MIKRIDSRDTQTSVGQITHLDSRRPIFSPNRKRVIAALGVVSAVLLASTIDLRGDSSRDVTPASLPNEVPNTVTPESPETTVLEPGSVLAVAEAYRIADITNPNVAAREASIREAEELIGFQP